MFAEQQRKAAHTPQSSGLKHNASTRVQIKTACSAESPQAQPKRQSIGRISFRSTATSTSLPRCAWNSHRQLKCDSISERMNFKTTTTTTQKQSFSGVTNHFWRQRQFTEHQCKGARGLQAAYELSLLTRGLSPPPESRGTLTERTLLFNNCSSFKIPVKPFAFSAFWRKMQHS